MTRQARNLDYRLVIASAYGGFLVWHAGFSGSVPLVIATPGHFLEDAMGVVPAGETIFAPYNLAIAGALLVVLPFVNRAMLPPPEQRVVVDPEVLEEAAGGGERPSRDVMGYCVMALIVSGIIITAGLLLLT